MTRLIRSAETNGLAASWISTEAGAALANASSPARTDSCRRAPPATVSRRRPACASLAAA